LLLDCIGLEMQDQKGRPTIYLATNWPEDYILAGPSLIHIDAEQGA